MPATARSWRVSQGRASDNGLYINNLIISERRRGLVTKQIAILCGALFVVLCLPALNFQAQTQDVVLVGAGDIARCGPDNLSGPQATATLIDSIPGSVFA